MCKTLYKIIERLQEEAGYGDDDGIFYDNLAATAEVLGLEVWSRAEIPEAVRQLREDNAAMVKQLNEQDSRMERQHREWNAEVLRLQALLKEERYKLKRLQQFSSNVRKVLGTSVAILPAGETWSALDGSVIQYLRDIIAATKRQQAMIEDLRR